MTRPPATTAPGTWPCVAPHGDGLWLAVSASPNARRTQAEGLHDGALRVRLAAPPVEGKANDLLVGWVADQLGLPRRAVRLARGESSRRKWLAIDAAPSVVEQWLESLARGPQ